MDELDITGAVLIAIGAILLLLPPRFDPAIRLKEWLQDKDRPNGQ